MIYELRTYTIVAGKQAEYMRLHRDVGREVRGDKYGKLEGGWTTEIGPLNQYVHLWSYDDLEDRTRARAGLAADERWNKEYVPQIIPLVLAQQNTILTSVDGVPFTPPSDGGRHVYELRTYRTQMGKLAEWVKEFKVGLQTREKYSKIVGLWTSEVGQLNQVSHLWAYRDLNHRAEVRGKAMQDPDWQTFLGKGTPLLAEMHTTILLPTGSSPLQ
jgi:hypothetical protein